MNRNELKRMLSQVDEQYITEILNDEESTTEAVTEIQRSSHFSRWTAIAAVVCICAVGGGCLAWGRLHPPKPAKEQLEDQLAEITASDTAIEHASEYDLLWEIYTEPMVCIDYTLEAGGEMLDCGSPILPFADGCFNEVRSTFFCDENGNAVNFSAHLKNGEKSVRLTISDRGHLFPANFFVDFSEDVHRAKPAIHIYEMSETAEQQEFELYYLHGGIGMSMEVSGYTAKEAEAFAATLLKDNTTAAKLYADTMNSETKQEPSDKSEYFRMDMKTLPMLKGELDNVKTVYIMLDDYSLPFDISEYTSGGYSEVYCIGGDVPNHAVIYLSGESEKSIKLQMSQEEDMFGGVPFPENGGVDYRGITLYGARPMGMEPQSILTFVMNDTGFTLRFQKLTDEEIFAIVDALIDSSFSLQSIPLEETIARYPTLEELQADEQFGFAAPQSRTYGNLQLHEDRTIITAQRNTETDSLEPVLTLFFQYAYVNDYQCFINFNVNNVLVSDDMQPSPVSADSITEESVLKGGLPGADGCYTYDYIISVGEFYFTVNGHCKPEEMWLFLKDVLRK